MAKTRAHSSVEAKQKMTGIKRGSKVRYYTQDSFGRIAMEILTVSNVTADKICIASKCCSFDYYGGQIGGRGRRWIAPLRS